MKRVETYNHERISGVIAKCEVDNYGVIELFIDDDIVTNFQKLARQNMSEMPKEYVYKTAKDFKWEWYEEDISIPRKIASRFVNDFSMFRMQGRGLYIYSKARGCGKTMLSCCLANEIEDRQDISIKFTSASDYIELVKARTEDARDREKRIRDASLLIIDDIGVQTEKDSSHLFRLIDYRYRENLPIIYTSNITMDDLRIDNRIKDRIFDTSYTLSLPEVPIREETAKRHTAEFINAIINDESVEDIF